VPNLGAVAIGALAGLGLGIIGAIPLLAGGLDAGSVGGQSALILVGLVAQFVAGYLAARVAGRDLEVHGGLGALTLFGITGAVALGANQDPGAGTLVVGALTALVAGTLGGFLARARDA